MLFRLGPEDHLILLSVHHAVTDGWSNGVLAQSLSDCYRDLTAGRPVTLPAPNWATGTTPPGSVGCSPGRRPRS
ncbi:condensation domain-containing protein [Streptomyces sp. M19]